MIETSFPNFKEAALIISHYDKNHYNDKNKIINI